MKVTIANFGSIDFATVEHADVTLDESANLRAAIEEARAAIVAGESSPATTAAWTTVATFGSALLGESFVPPAAVLRLVHEWMSANPRTQPLFWLAMAVLRPQDMTAWARRMIEASPRAVPQVYGCAVMAPNEQHEPILRLLAEHADPQAALHFFELLGHHRRIAAPGSLDTRGVDDATLLVVLQIGVHHRHPRIRERAIAAAYGMGKINLIRDQVIAAATTDSDVEVRQFALVALDTMDDTATLAILRDALARGDKPEIVAAILGLARRPDGLPFALAMAADPRPWVHDELLYAVATAAAPLSDQDVAALTASLGAHPDTDGAIAANRRRHRADAPAPGADRWQGVTVRRATPGNAGPR